MQETSKNIKSNFIDGTKTYLLGIIFSSTETPSYLRHLTGTWQVSAQTSRLQNIRHARQTSMVFKFLAAFKMLTSKITTCLPFPRCKHYHQQDQITFLALKPLSLHKLIKGEKGTHQENTSHDGFIEYNFPVKLWRQNLNLPSPRSRQTKAVIFQDYLYNSHVSRNGLLGEKTSGGGKKSGP